MMRICLPRIYGVEVLSSKPFMNNVVLPNDDLTEEHTFHRDTKETKSGYNVILQPYNDEKFQLRVSHTAW